MYCPSSEAVVAQTKMLGDLISSESPLSQFVNNSLSLCPSLVGRAGGLFPASFTRTPVSVTLQRPYLLIESSPWGEGFPYEFGGRTQTIEVSGCWVSFCSSLCLCAVSGCLRLCVYVSPRGYEMHESVSMHIYVWISGVWVWQRKNEIYNVKKLSTRWWWHRPVIPALGR